GSSISLPGDSHPAGRESIECPNAAPAPLSPSRRKILPLFLPPDHSVSPNPDRHQNADHDHRRILRQKRRRLPAATVSASID
ncbi:MAG: hypothetical protein ACYDHV_01555, partial [Desulfurivibrionaceae bacterium]